MNKLVALTMSLWLVACSTAGDAGQPDAMAPLSDADTTAPDTTITSSPDALSNVGSPVFEFTSSEAGSTFQCRINAGSFSPCTSPHAIAAPEGANTFEVYATDPTGNDDASPATYNWTVDTVAPVTTLMGGPVGIVPDLSATFTFTANEAASFECSLDGATFAPCTSPVTASNLSVGAHMFAVRATDSAGNAESPGAEHGWSVCAVQSVSYTIDATTDVAIDYVSGNKAPANRLAAYRNPGSSLDDVSAWTGYDLSTVPDNVTISAITMSYHHEIGFGNPFSNPVVVVHYSTGNDWARGTVTLSELPRTQVVSASYNTFTTGTWNNFAINVSARSWDPDLADDWLTIGLTNTNSFYSYVYFLGTDSITTAPYVTINGTLCQ